MLNPVVAFPRTRLDINCTTLSAFFVSRMDNSLTSIHNHVLYSEHFLGGLFSVVWIHWTVYSTQFMGILVVREEFWRYLFQDSFLWTLNLAHRSGQLHMLLCPQLCNHSKGLIFLLPFFLAACQLIGGHHDWTWAVTLGDHWCPEEDASLLSKLFFAFCNSLMTLGAQKTLNQEDLWSLASCDEASAIVATFERNLEATKNPEKRPQVIESKHSIISGAKYP